MRRFACLLLCGILLLSWAVPAAAEEDDGYEALRQQIIAAAHTGEPLNISEYKLSREEMEDIYQDLFHRGMLPWYADSYCDWTSAPDKTVAVITVRDLRKRGFSEDSYERAMAELIAATCLDGMTDTQKVLSVHDYIVSRAGYSYLSNTNNGYHALVKHETACYGYAQLFMRVMERLGIPCQIAVCEDTGNGSGHAWNVVQLDGNWYHLDLTWDDGVPDAPGAARHHYFLKTDQEFLLDLGHDFGWDCNYTCTDKSFLSDTLGEGIDSHILFLDANTAILRQLDLTGLSVYSVNIQTGRKKLLWKSPLDYYSSSLCYWNGRIWFNTYDTVISADPDGGNKKVEYVYGDVSEERYIYGFQVNDGTLTVTLLEVRGDAYRISKESVELSNCRYHIHDYETSYVSAACETGGYTQKACVCGITYQIDRSDPLGHTLTEEIQSGMLRQQCLHCDFVHEEPIATTQPLTTDPTPTEAVEAVSGDDQVPIIGALAAGIAVLLAVTVLLRRRSAGSKSRG